MTDTEVITLVNDRIAEEFELAPEAMRPEATLFVDLGLDSLDIVDLVVVLESTFHLKIRDDKALREIRTLGDVHAYVIRKRSELAATA
jgi:acyl carrier protein